MINCHNLGELGLGPKLLGVFDGGRLEEFIPSRCLTTEDLVNNPLIRKQIMQKLARTHNLKNIPIDRRPFLDLNGLEGIWRKFETESEQEKFKEFCNQIGQDGR